MPPAIEREALADTHYRFNCRVLAQFVMPDWGGALTYLLAGVGALILLWLISGLRYIPNPRQSASSKNYGLRRALCPKDASSPSPVRRATRHIPVAAACMVWLTAAGNTASHRTPLVTISQGKIGYVYARDGEPLPPTQTLGRVVDCNNFQDSLTFYGLSKTKPVLPGRAGDSGPSFAKSVYAINPGPFRGHHRRRRL